MKGLEKLTPEQIELAEKVREEWAGLVLRDRPELDHKAVREDIKWLYSTAGLKPPLVVIVDSPMACQFAVKMLWELAKGERWETIERMNIWTRFMMEIQDQILQYIKDEAERQSLEHILFRTVSQVKEQVEDHVKAHGLLQIAPHDESEEGASFLLNFIRDEIWEPTFKDVMRKLDYESWNRIWKDVWVNISNRIEDRIIYTLIDQILDQLFLSGYYFHPWATALGDMPFGALADFYRRAGLVRNDKLDRYLAYLRRGVWYSAFFEHMAIVCGPPAEIHLDAQQRLHREDGPAILCNDGYAGYWWHGVRVPRKLIEEPDAVAPEDFFREGNAEVRRAYKERLGTERFVALFDPVVVDRDVIGAPGYEQEYVLYCTKRPDKTTGEHIQWVKVTCHSTGRKYMLLVPPHIKNVYRALAWTFGKEPENYRPVVEA